MNKRQKKKMKKEAERRMAFINSHTTMSGRQNGKVIFRIYLFKIVSSNKYRPFKLLEREYHKLRHNVVYAHVDHACGQSYSVRAHCQFINGVYKIIHTEFM